MRGLLDQGSQVSFVSETIAVMLNLPLRAVQIPLEGLGSVSASTARSATHVTLRSIYESDFQLEFQALILPRLTLLLADTRLIELDIPAMTKLPLVEPQFYEPERVDLLLGAEVYGKLLRPGLKHFPPHNLIAQDTHLGWILSDSIEQSPPGRAESFSSPRRVEPTSINLVTLHCKTEENLSETLQRFWELEEVPPNPSKLSPDEELCEQIFANTHSRSATGRYIVRLPLRAKLPAAASATRSLALKSIISMKRRFVRDPVLCEECQEFIDTNEKLGHMQRVPVAELNNPQTSPRGFANLGQET